RMQPAESAAFLLLPAAPGYLKAPRFHPDILNCMNKSLSATQSLREPRRIVLHYREQTLQFHGLRCRFQSSLLYRMRTPSPAPYKMMMPPKLLTHPLMNPD